MAEMKPYWFIESPIDFEYKYYVLMAYLMKVKGSFGENGFEKNFKHLLTIKKDLESFVKNTELSQKSRAKMTEDENDNFYNILDTNLDSIGEIEEIAKNSISVIDKFIEENRADISNEIDMEIGTELSKEKSIDIIMTRFKH